MAREAGERRRLILSFAYFGLLLASYYLVRPVRDALAAGLGPDAIKYLATAVFVTMAFAVPVFGWLVSRVPRTRLLPGIYGFFALNLVAFSVAFHVAPCDHWIARAFYVWTTVFSLFVVSVFWSFMADLWTEEQGRRLFGVIAAGGSLGGLLGPLAARALAADLGESGLALVAALLLAAALVVVFALLRDAGARGATDTARLGFDEPVGGELLAGLTGLARSPDVAGIATLVACGSLLGMLVYIELARAAATGFASGAARTAFYAQRDLWVNGIAFGLQLLAIGPLAQRLGVRSVLCAAAVVVAFAFGGLAALPLAGQGENPFPVFAAFGMDAATESPVGINPQMLAGAVVAAFGASGTAGLDNAAGQLPDFFQFGHVETHVSPRNPNSGSPAARSFTRFQPRLDFLPSRSMQWFLATCHSSSITSAAMRSTTVIGSAFQPRSAQYSA